MPGCSGLPTKALVQTAQPWEHLLLESSLTTLTPLLVRVLRLSVLRFRRDHLLTHSGECALPGGACELTRETA